MIDEADYHLQEGEIKMARPLVAKLANETLRRTVKMPLAHGILLLIFGAWFSRQGDFRTNTGYGRDGEVKYLCMTHRLREKHNATLKVSGGG